MLIAHRGHSSIFQDNSIKAFESAIKLNFDMIELDINICKSGELIIYHDLLINGINVNNYSLSELNKYNIITLKEYFKLSNNKIKTYIDVKGGNNLIMKTLINFLNNEKYIDLSLIYIATFNTNQLELLENSNLHVKTGLITANIFTIDEMKNWIDKYDFFVFNWENFNNQLYNYVHEFNKKIFLYTCHNIKEYIYINNNIRFDGIISNIYINNYKTI